MQDIYSLSKNRIFKKSTTVMFRKAFPNCTQYHFSSTVSSSHFSSQQSYECGPPTVTTLFYLVNIYLFVSFWLHWVLVGPHGIFSLWHMGSALRCAGFSLIEVYRLSCPIACGIWVPPTGIEPISPALQGRFLTTAPPGNSLTSLFRSVKMCTTRQVHLCSGKFMCITVNEF